MKLVAQKIIPSIIYYEWPRFPKLRLPNLENRPLREPTLLPKLELATDALDKAAAGSPLATLTKESWGDSAMEIDAASPLSPPPGAEETPLIPWRARCARCRCNGVCLDPAGRSDARIVPRVTIGERSGGDIG